MSFMWCEGFETGDGSRWSSFQGTVNGTASINGSYGWAPGSNNVSSVSDVGDWDSSSDSLCLGFHFKKNQARDPQIVSMGQNLGTNRLFYFRLDDNTSNQLLLYAADSLNGGDSLIGTSATNTIVNGSEHWIEVEFGVNDTTGVGKVWVDGSIVINFSGDTKIDTGALGSGAVDMQWHGDADEYYDDIVIWNTATVGNDPFNSSNMGEMQIEAIVPDGDTATADFTTTESSHYLAVNDIPYNDSQHNQSSTVTDRDMLTYGNRTHTGTPLALQLSTRALKTSANARTLSPILDGSSLQVQTAVTLSTSATWYENAFGVDIDGSVWDNTAVNAVEAGYEIAS